MNAPRTYGGIFDYDAKFERLRTVNASLEDPSIWNDPKKAQELGKEKKSLDTVVLTLEKLTTELADNSELFEMSREEGDEAGLLTIEAETAKLQPLIEELEFRRMFSHEADPLNCYIDIQAGAGGTEACDWASILLRQYLKYAERKGFKATVDDETPGDVAGIKGATIHIEGEYACCAPKPACTAWCARAHSTARAGATPALPACLSTPRLMTRSRSTSTPLMCAPTLTAHPARAASTSTRPTRPCA